ncbi:type III-B CRISPR module-associated protein Cmr5 [Myxococcota bacterium]|nr:type III-B CRISPR module-associated protein Cmr5 [Myxococcota bacterium]
METRDQKRALHAYQTFEDLRSKNPEAVDAFRILVNDLGAHIHRSGLAMTIAFLERAQNQKERAATALLGALASAKIPGLDEADAKTIGDRVRKLDLDTYMLATRETIRLTIWLKRAIQARG